MTFSRRRVSDSLSVSVYMQQRLLAHSASCRRNCVTCSANFRSKRPVFQVKKVSSRVDLKMNSKCLPTYDEGSIPFTRSNLFRYLADAAPELETAPSSWAPGTSADTALIRALTSFRQFF